MVAPSFYFSFFDLQPAYAASRDLGLGLVIKRRACSPSTLPFFTVDSVQFIAYHATVVGYVYLLCHVLAPRVVIPTTRPCPVLGERAFDLFNSEGPEAVRKPES